MTLFRLETMSLFESEESNGTVSLSELFKNPNMEIEAKSNLELESIIFAACRGGDGPDFLQENRTGQNFRLPEITLTACARLMFLLLTA